MTQERICDIEKEMFDVKNKIDEVSKTISSLNEELCNLKDTFHSLKEAKFEIANNITKGDIIVDNNGVKYCYKGLSKDWTGNFLVSKITKAGLPSKNTIHVWHSKFDFETKLLFN